MTETLYRLQMLAGPRAGQAVPLDGTRLTIGRYPLAEIVLDDPQVAYRHAVLTRTGDTWRLVDLNSDTGTAVNGQRAGAEPVALQPGDLIVLGAGVSMTFEVEGPPIEEAVEGEYGAPPVIPDGNGETEEYEAPLLAPDDPLAADEEPAGEPAMPEWPALPPLPAAETPRLATRSGQVFSAPPADPPRRRGNRWWWALAGCLVLLLLCCCTFTVFMYLWGGDWLLQQMGYLP